MNNLSMALKNLKKNFSFYALYLLSVSFVITVFFASTSFSMNTIMLEKVSGNGRVEMMCNVISVFLMAFVVFICHIPTVSFYVVEQKNLVFTHY